MKLIQRATNWTTFCALLIEALAWSSLERFLPGVLVLVLAGAIGNGIDRVRFGFVVDFISLYYERWSWPTFNVADLVISLGVLLLILKSFSSKPDG